MLVRSRPPRPALACAEEAVSIARKAGPGGPERTRGSALLAAAESQMREVARGSESDIGLVTCLFAPIANRRAGFHPAYKCPLPRVPQNG